MKTEQFYNKNQFIIREGKKITFQSYGSTIAIYDGENLVLGADWDYSSATRKHLYLFIEDFCPQFATYSKNKRKDIQNMIDNAMIGYSEALR